MSTSPNTVSAFMLSLSEFACLVSEQHYRFLSQSLNNLEHQIEQHRVERHLMELHITNLQQQTTQWCPDAMSTSPTSRTPSLLSDIESEHHRRSFNNHEPPSNPSSHNISIHDSSFDQSEDRVSNPRTTNMGSRRNPIYILDDDKVRCEGCWEEGHFIWDCNREYQYDGEPYIPIVREENLMEPMYVVDRDYYQREHPRCQARP